MPVQVRNTKAGDALSAGEAFTHFVPFAKVDPVKHLVTGVATSEAWDDQNEQMAWEGICKAVTDYGQWRNIRAMHGPQAVGVAPLIILDTVGKSVTLSSHIVDPVEWQKVVTGVYKGYSIAGRKLDVEARWNPELGKQGTRIKEFLWSETSLVDRPSNPEAVFHLIKRASGIVAVRKVVAGGATHA